MKMYSCRDLSCITATRCPNDPNSYDIRDGTKVRMPLDEGILHSFYKRSKKEAKKETVKWYRFCILARKNQKKAIEKHPGLYSKAGKIAQQKHPLIGHNLGKKYGPIVGKKRAQQLKGNSKYFSTIAKRLQKINPEHSRRNMKKAHETMKKKGTFSKHQKKAALECRRKHPK